MKNSTVVDVTNNEMIVIAAFMTLSHPKHEAGFSDFGVDEIAAETKKTKTSVKGIVSSLVKKEIFVVEPVDFPGLVYLHDNFFSYHPVWHTEADSRKQKDLTVNGKEVKRIPVKKETKTTAKAKPKAKAKATTTKKTAKASPKKAPKEKKGRKLVDHIIELKSGSEKFPGVQAGAKVEFTVSSRSGKHAKKHLTGTVVWVRLDTKANNEYVKIKHPKLGDFHKVSSAVKVKK